MSEPKFRSGQLVEFARHAPNAPAGPYEVVRLLPSDTAEPRYRIRSRNETHERVVAEHELRAAGGQAT
jgi:hypothetical protein